jgi:excisionase family DNA binding protein
MTDELLTAAEAAKRLGTFETSREAFPRWLIAQRRIRFVRVGRLVRIPESAIDEFIEQGTVQPVERVARWGRSG